MQLRNSTQNRSLAPAGRGFLAVSLTILSWGWSAQVAGAQEEPRKAADTAILIVGDDSNPEMLRREKALIGEMARTLKKQQRIPIYSYHFNKPRERSYCEKKLNVLSEDLLFVGVVSLAERVPKKVLYRIDRIVTPARAANDVLARSDEMLGLGGPDPSSGVTPAVAGTSTIPVTAPADPAVTAPASPPSHPGTAITTSALTPVRPAPKPVPPVQAPVQPPVTESVRSPRPVAAAPSHAGQAGLRLAPSGHWRVQLGVFSQMKRAQEVLDQLKAKGFEGRVDKLAGEDKNFVFKVYVGPFASKEDALQGSGDLHGNGFSQSFVVETH